MKINLNIYRDRVYSQFGEDGITLKIFELIGTTNKIAVEIGTENGNECCSRVLRERLGFSCILFDDKNERLEINLNRATVTVDNVIGLLEEKSIPKDLDFLCVDIDSYDFYIVHTILQKYHPKLLIVETNPVWTKEDKVVKLGYPMSNFNAYCGAGLGAWYKTLNSKYDLVCHEQEGINAFFILKGLLKDEQIENINNIEGLFKAHPRMYNYRDYPSPSPAPILTSDAALKLLHEHQYSNSK